MCAKIYGSDVRHCSPPVIGQRAYVLHFQDERKYATKLQGNVTKTEEWDLLEQEN